MQNFSLTEIGPANRRRLIDSLNSVLNLRSLKDDEMKMKSVFTRSPVFMLFTLYKGDIFLG